MSIGISELIIVGGLFLLLLFVVVALVWIVISRRPRT